MQARATAVFVALIALPASQTFAATVDRSEVSLSASRCQPALPAFDGAIRKRPLAMQNESSNTTAFVTCAFDGVGADVRSRSVIEVDLVNTIPAVPGELLLTSVSCTLVDGGPGFAAPVYITKSTTYGAGAGGPITFTAADNGGQPFLYAAVSCGLPASFGIRSANSTYAEEIGG